MLDLLVLAFVRPGLDVLGFDVFGLDVLGFDMLDFDMLVLFKCLRFLTDFGFLLKSLEFPPPGSFLRLISSSELETPFVFSAINVVSLRNCVLSSGGGDFFGFIWLGEYASGVLTVT